MSSGIRTAAWTIAALAGIATAVISGIFLKTGIEKADMLASAISCIIGILTLALAAISIVQAWSNWNSTSSTPTQTQKAGNNSKQFQSGGDMTIGDDNQL